MLPLVPPLALALDSREMMMVGVLIELEMASEICDVGDHRTVTHSRWHLPKFAQM